MNRGLLLLFGIIGVAALLGIACGGGAPPPADTVAPPPPTAPPTTTATPPGDGDGPAARGQVLAQTASPTPCVVCHSADGRRLVGPSWQGIYGIQETLVGDTTAEVNDEYLRESIVDPNAKIVKGFAPNIMPGTYGDTLSNLDVDDIIAYIKTLQ